MQPLATAIASLYFSNQYQHPNHYHNHHYTRRPVNHQQGHHHHRHHHHHHLAVDLPLMTGVSALVALAVVGRAWTTLVPAEHRPAHHHVLGHIRPSASIWLSSSSLFVSFSI